MTHLLAKIQLIAILIVEQDSTYDFTYSTTLYYQDQFNKFLDHLTRLHIDRIENVSFSNQTNCLNYGGRRFLFVSTIIKQDKRDTKALIKKANEIFRGKDPEKYPILIIDNKCITPDNSKKAISSLKSNNIYFISINSSLPPNIYCPKNSNGLVRVCKKE